MIKEAIKKHNIDVSSSIFIGDRKIDIDCAKKVKCKSIFINRNYNERKPVGQIFSTNSLKNAVRYIIKNEKI